MRRTMLKSKIHRATVTGADLEYVGSMTLDPILIEEADLLVHEKVEIYNITNGERFATYVIEGERGRGEVVLNGAAAHKASPGDLVIICSYADYDEAELAEHRPTIVFVDDENRPVSKDDAVDSRHEANSATDRKARRPSRQRRLRTPGVLRHLAPEEPITIEEMNG